jgi:hypothetical protein
LVTFSWKRTLIYMGLQGVTCRQRHGVAEPDLEEGSRLTSTASPLCKPQACKTPLLSQKATRTQTAHQLAGGRAGLRSQRPRLWGGTPSPISQRPRKRLGASDPRKCPWVVGLWELTVKGRAGYPMALSPGRQRPQVPHTRLIGLWQNRLHTASCFPASLCRLTPHTPPKSRLNHVRLHHPGLSLQRHQGG